ncbi:MAG: methyltransferase domain-containing protein [candidate division WOR-3 bacterium]|nr:MAG: methyltransferase domain-containing protein [candidate division WOR-3 bacterium]
MKRGYYDDRLHGNLLMHCYDLAPPRIRQYLSAEIDYVLEMIKPGDRILELGCGYGRVLHPLTSRAGFVVGIDTSAANIECGEQLLACVSNYGLLVMDAVQTGFRDNAFDCVVCIQNGISAFAVDQKALINESLRITKGDGLAIFSSYSPLIWNERLLWFQRQAEAGLIGEIDPEETREGIIVCKDGFVATTVSAERFRDLVTGIPAEVNIDEVDGSSIFCVLKAHKKF